MAFHDLKCWPEFYGPLTRGEKTFEVRRDDRGYAVGDVLGLREWNPESKRYTGNVTSVRVTFLMPLSRLGIEGNFVVMGVSR